MKTMLKHLHNAMIQQWYLSIAIVYVNLYIASLDRGSMIDMKDGNNKTTTGLSWGIVLQS